MREENIKTEQETLLKLPSADHSFGHSLVKLARNKLVLAIAAITLLVGAVPAGAGIISYTFKTDIREINSGTGNANDFMTIQINQAVGPIDCRSNVLKVGDDPHLRQKIETLAMSALVQQDQVMIRIPVSRGDCIDGSPAILDMYLLHNS